ncbi:hypothetical protein E2C01_028860 [Portunus trituberculatus]|uniref:Secreted protein n=1 Tax=Portunus trituberculatus TaxID=210409 RepID=A0A5B7EQ90_PORTR|nr:hypothetical protein [Portunus trituberculatus]
MPPPATTALALFSTHLHLSTSTCHHNQVNTLRYCYIECLRVKRKKTRSGVSDVPLTLKVGLHVSIFD